MVTDLSDFRLDLAKKLGADRTVTVQLNDGGTETITAANVILASGSVPRLIPNFERGGPIMTSDEVLDLDPDRPVESTTGVNALDSRPKRSAAAVMIG